MLAESKMKWWATMRDGGTHLLCCYNRLGLFLGDPTHFRKAAVIFRSLDHYPLLHTHIDTKDVA